MTLLDYETREYAKQEVSRKRLALVPPHEARPGKTPRKRKSKRPATPALAPTGERFDVGADLAASVMLHPSFRRVVGACCPFSGLSRAELEQHVAGVLAMVDEADRRERVA